MSLFLAMINLLPENVVPVTRLSEILLCLHHSEMSEELNLHRKVLPPSACFSPHNPGVHCHLANAAEQPRARKLMLFMSQDLCPIPKVIYFPMSFNIIIKPELLVNEMHDICMIKIIESSNPCKKILFPNLAIPFHLLLSIYH